MRITTKGQVTIPLHIRKKLGLVPHSEVTFTEEGDRVYLVPDSHPLDKPNKFRRFRGVATVRMTTEEIMALTRGDT